MTDKSEERQPTPDYDPTPYVSPPLPTPPDDDSLHEEWLREAADEFEHCQRVQALEAWARWQFG